MTDKVLIDRSVLEQALAAINGLLTFNTTPDEYAEGRKAKEAIRAALEQEPAPNCATHRQPKQGAFYKRVDGKWYVWSRMENGQPHRWYISPGTTESCLEPINAAAPQPRLHPLTTTQITELENQHSSPESVDDFYLDAIGFARAIERAHGIGG